MLIIAQAPTPPQTPPQKIDEGEPFPFEEVFREQPPVQEPIVDQPVEPEPFPDPMTPTITAPVDEQELMAPAPGRLPSVVGEPPPLEVDAPGPGTPEDPAELFEEVLPPETPIEQKNKIMDVRQKVAFAIDSGTPLRINYTTLPYPDNASGTSSHRVIVPDYVYWAGTGRHIVVGWDNNKGDWRAFALDRIASADLVEEAA